MSHSFRSKALKNTACLGLAGAIVLALAPGASAEDGLQGWLSSVFGGEVTPVSAPRQVMPAAPPRIRRLFGERTRFDDRDGRAGGPDRARSGPWRPRWGRPLVVRLHRPAPRSATAQVPSKPGVVSIFLDRTLRRGDAVMMADGMRVFAGSASWPYVKADFVAVADAKHVSRSTTKVLADLDLLPRN